MENVFIVVKIYILDKFIDFFIKFLKEYIVEKEVILLSYNLL